MCINISLRYPRVYYTQGCNILYTILIHLCINTPLSYPRVFYTLGYKTIMHKGINPLYHTYTRVYKHVSQVFEGFFLLSLSFVIPIGPMPDNGQSSFKKLNIFCFIVYYNTFEQKSKENGQQVVIISAKYIFRDSFLVVVVIRPCSNRCCQVLLLVIHKIHTTS